MSKAEEFFHGDSGYSFYERITPTPEQINFLQDQWNSMADHLKKELPKHGFPVSTWLQGSYKHGTLLKPIIRNARFDVDVGVYFEWDPANNQKAEASTLRGWVQEELKRYAQQSSAIAKVESPPKERCSRVIYKEQFHIDTPVYHLAPNNDQRRLALLSGKDSWEDSDPKKLYLWFKDSVGNNNHAQLRRLIRYLKGWAAITFNQNVLMGNSKPAYPSSALPSSTLLTVVTTQAFKKLCNDSSKKLSDETALSKVIAEVEKRLKECRKVPNPIDPEDENLNRIPTKSWPMFLAALAKLNEAASSAKDAPDEISSALIWERVFSFLFPLPQPEKIDITALIAAGSLRQNIDIKINVYDNNPIKLITTYLNKVPSVSCNKTLVFELIRPEKLPQNAEISWTVRNYGEIAERAGDLGHSKKGIGLYSVEQHAGYLGKHFMDCVIRINDDNYALRRVPVNINS